MTRSNRPCAAIAACKQHVSRLPCEHSWCSHGARKVCDLRAVVAAGGIIVWRFTQLHNDAVE
eukprot:8709050-Lingulodinium_polyedra.AAC.1